MRQRRGFYGLAPMSYRPMASLVLVVVSNHLLTGQAVGLRTPCILFFRFLANKIRGRIANLDCAKRNLVSSGGKNQCVTTLKCSRFRYSLSTAPQILLLLYYPAVGKTGNLLLKNVFEYRMFHL